MMYGIPSNVLRKYIYMDVLHDEVSHSLSNLGGELHARVTRVDIRDVDSSIFGVPKQYLSAR